MKIFAVKYKGIDGIQVEAKKIKAIFLPSEGGKMASFRTLDGKEYLLQNPSEKFLLGTDGDFVKTECAGFDDMFPTIDPDGAYPDHGEICRSAFRSEIFSDRLVLSAQSKKFPYTYKKTITEGQDGEIEINYEILNTSDKPMPALWAAHCLVDSSSGGEILLPFKERAPVDLLFDVYDKFKRKTIRTELTEEMTKLPKIKERTDCYKLYFPQESTSFHVGFHPTDRLPLVMTVKGLTQIGIWVNEGYFNGVRCVGLEPCSVGYDSVSNAAKYGKIGEIPPKIPFRFELSLNVNGEPTIDIDKINNNQEKKA